MSLKQRTFTKKDLLLLILGLLSDYGKNMVESRTKVMKVVFLVQEELKDMLKQIISHKELYEFEWYLFGPFSKDVLFDLERLEKEGYIEIVPEDMSTYIQYNFVLTRKGIMYLKELSGKIPREVLNVLKSHVDKFKHMTATEIKQYVYKRYLYA